jgi:hypothetical protein
VALAGPLGDPAGTCRAGRSLIPGLGRLRRAGGRQRGDGCAQAAGVPGYCPFHAVAEVVPQVPPVGDLDRRAGRSPGAAVKWHSQVLRLSECLSLDALSPEDRGRVAVDLVQQVADVG